MVIRSVMLSLIVVPRDFSPGESALSCSANRALLPQTNQGGHFCPPSLPNSPACHPEPALLSLAKACAAKNLRNFTKNTNAAIFADCGTKTKIYKLLMQLSRMHAPGARSWPHRSACRGSAVRWATFLKSRRMAPKSPECRPDRPSPCKYPRDTWRADRPLFHPT